MSSVDTDQNNMSIKASLFLPVDLQQLVQLHQTQSAWHQTELSSSYTVFSQLGVGGFERRDLGKLFFKDVAM